VDERWATSETKLAQKKRVGGREGGNYVLVHAKNRKKASGVFIPGGTTIGLLLGSKEGGME